MLSCWYCHSSKQKRENEIKWKDKNNQIKKKSECSKKCDLKILGDIGSRHHQTSGDETKILKKDYLRRTRKALETKLHSRNFIKGMNTWVFSSCKIFGTIIKMEQGNNLTKCCGLQIRPVEEQLKQRVIGEPYCINRKKDVIQKKY